VPRQDDLATRAFEPEELLGPLNDVERKYAPKQLFASGRVDLLRERARVAIVGTRRPTADGEKRARRLARILVRERVVVVSGLAEGIDTIAHRTAIAEGGDTIAVIGTPLARAYPRSNAALQQYMSEHQLVVTQFGPRAAVRRASFPLRNRTMALISHVSVIVEAGEGSGSLSQGWEALRLGRKLFILRSTVENASLTWPRKMLEHGAEVLAQPDQILTELPPPSYWDAADAPF